MQFRRKKEGKGDTAKASNPAPSTPYLNARREWNERYGDVVKNANSWRVAALTVGVYAILSTSMNFYQVASEKIAVYYVNLNERGAITSIFRADQANGTPEAQQVRRALQDWVIGARTVYADYKATKKAVDYTYAMTLPDSPAFTELANYHRANNPYQRAAEETVEVSVQTPVNVAGDTWMVEWTETRHNRVSGKVIGQPITYQLTANILLAKPASEQQLMANPTGLYVRSFSWPVRNN
ncbi:MULTISPECIES: type IV secretion system protein [Gammaproteobacteria]|uniref:type IV secretion system protein n=1 Tax=Gammaproteobacteria TaxID=1236 RepID=UPI000798A5DB|nr:MULTISPECIES: type IV secretion system protein [Gammaproteobacteria]EAO5102655.1 type IV secretion system protein [Salmonella enterica]EBS0352111.1 conjugal transfer protein [Salmonella enterica subsp. enterica serovar Java]EBW7170414.1 conjugal transfer protein [Salmonella enterica subsp. enterica serovar Javiana]ECD7684172.1 type IV secretion system protein [Salmonella enterica subsp. enterica serovar Typhimurium]ECM3357605.1 type IV secretion system protein [Salmonella enterica subsp. en